MIDRRRQDLGRHLDDLRKVDGWHPFQNFVLGLLHHDGYRDVRHSNVRSDYGRDAMAITPDGKRCVVAVSFDSSKTKVLSDAERFLEDPDHEEAEVLLFVTAEAPAETTWSSWKTEVAALGLELRMFHRETILEIGTRDDVWRETCARLGIPGDRPGYRLIEPYDRELVRAALQARPAEWLGRLIELREWEKLSGEVHNQIVLGKPGAGKTTTLLFQLERAQPQKVLVVESDFREGKVEELLDYAAGGGVIVFDDAHAMPDQVRALMGALLARQRDVPGVSDRYQNVRLLLAARSQEWADVQTRLPSTQMQDLSLLGDSQIRLGALTRAQCRALVAACCDAWNLAAEPRLIEHAADVAAERDASPLYVLSMLAPVRAREDRTLRDEHLAHLPPDVLNLWRLYWSQLSTAQQCVLRLVKLFAVTAAPANLDLFNAAVRTFGLPLHEVSASLDQLESALWISRDDVLPSSLDVQIEAIPMGSNDLTVWDAFVREVPAASAEKVQLHNGTGVYHLSVRAPRMGTQAQRAEALRKAQEHFSSVSRIAAGAGSSLHALALNNNSICYADLAGLEGAREGRAAWLRKAVTAVEEAAAIYRELRLRGDLASSLNNISNRYSDLAELETNREGRAAWLRKAMVAVEEAVAIYRELGVQGDLASSLNNVSIRYSDLAGLETTREAHAGWLQKANTTGEESVAINRELGARSDLARCLNTVSNSYSDLAGLETTREGRAAWLQKAVVTREEALAIRRELGVQGDLASSLNNVSNSYADLARLETTREGRAAWLHKAVVAAEEAVTIRRELGVPGELAGSLNNVSSSYSDLVGLETTREGRAAWLQKAVVAGEEAVAIRRELGVQGDLAASLNNVSIRYSTLAGLETTRDGRAAWLRQAVLAVEEAVAIHRELGLQGNLASSLNNVSIRYLDLAGLETTREGRAAWLRKAVLAMEEAVAIRRELGIQGDLASSLNNISNHYSDLAGLETTNEDRATWLQKAVMTVEEAVVIYRALGVQGDLASSLNNVSNHYSNLAGLETTSERRAAWLQKAVVAVEEAVAIRRELGVQGDLASSLNNVSIRYSDRAGLETTREGRAAWLQKAVVAAGEAVAIERELGVQGDLAISLASFSRHLRTRAGQANDGIDQLIDLRASRDAIMEASRLFTVSGDTRFMLMSLEDQVIAHLLLLDAGDSVDEATVRQLCSQGKRLAQSMEDIDKINFFDEVLSQFQ
jgi:predicted RNA-binding protein YlxR (DUF448 family)